MKLLFFLLFPVFLSAQINRAYGVIEIGAAFPASSVTGPKFAYRTVDSSFYRWVSGNTWIKVIPDEVIGNMPFDSITFNNAISTLTIDGNGETIVGSAVTTGVAGSQRKFKFYSGIGWIKQY